LAQFFKCLPHSRISTQFVIQQAIAFYVASNVYLKLIYKKQLIFTEKL